jgi:hypothetical protein
MSKRTPIRHGEVLLVPVDSVPDGAIDKVSSCKTEFDITAIPGPEPDPPVRPVASLAPIPQGQPIPRVRPVRE